MARFAPGSAQTIGASLGLGLASAWEYLKRAWSVNREDTNGLSRRLW